MIQKTQKTWGELPQDIRETLSSDETVEKIEGIGKNQGLPTMEQELLVRICANLMKGIIEPQVFVSTISEELDIPREKAAFIAQEVNREIFSGIKESLKSVHAETSAKAASTPVVKVIYEPKVAPRVSAVAPQSPFEQKLGGAFQMESKAGINSAPPKLIVPDAPQAVRPASVVAPDNFSEVRPLKAEIGPQSGNEVQPQFGGATSTQSVPQRPKVDPYHELPV